MDRITAWLMEGPAWVQYRARVDLLGQAEDELEVRSARQAMLADAQVQALVTGLAAWPWPVISSHKSAGHPLHQLTFAVDLGLRVGDLGLETVAARILEQQAAQGPLRVRMNVPAHFGGSGHDEWAWALCDAPLLLDALARLGLAEDGRVQAAAQYLAGLARDNGWPCAVSPELGRFRGPGRKDDPCPYATLVMLQALSHLPEGRDSPAMHHGAEVLLSLWATSREQHPYQFYMGTDFRKLKAPLAWYDILHVLDVLTRFPWLGDDPRLHEMAQAVRGKADAQGSLTPESVWKAWADWEFGQKHRPSRWVTLLAWRALRRLGYALPIAPPAG